MNLVVCLKQVPDTASRIVVAPDGKEIQRQELSYVINPYDEYALEEALRLKATTGSGKVTLLSLGPQRVQEALRTGLAMGADEAVHLLDPAVEGSDALGVATVLAAALKKIPHDLIWCGWKAVDDDQATVGPMVATLLGIPCATFITTAAVAEGGAAVTAEREIERAQQTVTVPIPCVLTQQKGAHEPRYASLAGIMSSKKKTITTWTLQDLGVYPSTVGAAANHLEVVRLAPLPERQPGRILQGEPAQAVQELVRLLRTEAKVL